MALLSRWTLALSLAGSLCAQSLPDALAMVPEDASTLLIFKEAGLTDRKFKAFTGRFGKPSSFHNWKQVFGRDLDGFAGGPALWVERKDPKKKELSMLLVAPAPAYKALVRELKATPVGKLHTFKRGKVSFFMGSRDGFALLSKDRTFLNDVLQTHGRFQETLGPQLPWLQAQDVAGVVPEKALRQALASAKADLEKPELEEAPLSTAKATNDLVKEAVGALDASASYFAFSLNLAGDGGLKASARLFFKPGAPMASWAPQAFVHPLQGLPAAPYALAIGGPNPKVLSTWLTEVLVPLVHRDRSPEELQALKALEGELRSNIRSAAWSLGVPSAPGRGLLSATRAVLKVEDPARYLDCMERLTRLQAEQIAKKPRVEGEEAPAAPTFARNVLPSAPSATLTTPLAGPGSAPMDGMVKGLILGGDKLEMSLAQADEHSLVVAMGGAEPLQQALEAYRNAQGSLDQEAGIKAVDALLPASAPWRLYLHPGGLLGLANSVLSVIPVMPQGKTLPKVDAVPPVALGLQIDAQGIDLSFVATGSTLDAVAKWGQEMDNLFPKNAK